MSLFCGKQCVLVTGASSGIGRACALSLAEEGAHVIANGRNAETLATTREASTKKDRIFCEPFDLRLNIEFLPAWVQGLRQKYGRMWGLVHCAGETRLDSLKFFSLVDAREHFELNFLVPLQLAKAFATGTNYQCGGAMLFIASIAGVCPEKGQVLYGSVKAALIAAVKSISQEVISKKLRVNAISPAIVETPMFENACQKLGKKYVAKEKIRYPLGFGQPDDIAHLACFLLSDKAAWITGQNFIADGGAY